MIMSSSDQRTSIRKRQRKNDSHNEKKANSPQAAADVSPPSSPPSLLRRACGVLKYVVLAMVIPPFLNYASLQQETRLLQQNSTLYDVGFGQKLHLSCTGRGVPTVILDAPTGMSSDVWAVIQPELAKLTKVCSYDRAGLGFSERPYSNWSVAMEMQEEEPPEWADAWKQHMRAQEFTVERMAEDLHRLVTSSSQQAKPFIIVGAELGALVARFYSQLYEGEVSDLILLDPLVEDLFQHDNAIWRQFWFDHLVPSFQSMQLAAATGLARLFLLIGWMEPPITGELVSEEVMGRQKHLMCNPRHLSTVVDEYHFINETFSQINTLMRLKPFPSNISVTVMTGNYYDEQLPSTLNKAWAKSQQHLIAQLHPGSHHIVVNGADHHMLYRHPQAVIEQVKKVVKLARTRNLQQ